MLQWTAFIYFPDTFPVIHKGENVVEISTVLAYLSHWSGAGSAGIFYSFKHYPLTLNEHLLCARPYLKHFTCVKSYLLGRSGRRMRMKKSKEENLPS